MRNSTDPLGNMIRDARERAKIPQRELARRLDLDNKTVCRWERGKLRPNLRAVGRLCAVLGLSPGEVVRLAGG